MQKRGSEPSMHAQAQLKSEAELRQVLEAFSEAIRQGHLDEIMSFYSDDLTAFDLVPPLAFTNKSRYQSEAWEDCFTSVFNFPVTYDVSDLRVMTSGDLAIVHRFIHMMGKSKETGEQMECWFRSTLTFKNEDDEWLIVHEHNSVPMDKESGEGLMNLPPERPIH